MSLITLYHYLFDVAFQRDGGVSQESLLFAYQGLPFPSQAPLRFKVCLCVWFVLYVQCVTWCNRSSSEYIFSWGHPRQNHTPYPGSLCEILYPLSMYRYKTGHKYECTLCTRQGNTIDRLLLHHKQTHNLLSLICLPFKIHSKLCWLLVKTELCRSIMLTFIF